MIKVMDGVATVRSDISWRTAITTTDGEVYIANINTENIPTFEVHKIKGTSGAKDAAFGTTFEPSASGCGLGDRNKGVLRSSTNSLLIRHI
ncbi:MAG TPA: hypothetical protein GX707_05985 [Epulopiscium sp.]|nr:hypothetical protein [Candidatus Epulonipiscium sp.]